MNNSIICYIMQNPSRVTYLRAAWVLLRVSREAEERAEQREHKDHSVVGEQAGEGGGARAHASCAGDL